jgi:nucleoside-diphosphate-sugar epimerase
MELPKRITSEDQLKQVLATPYPELVQMMQRLDGDIMILGVGGKMGPSLAHLARNACNEANVQKRIIGVSRFSDKMQQKTLHSVGVETICCDLMNVDEVNALPKVKNVIFMAGRKFGVFGSETLTWMINTIVPGNVARAFKDSNIVVFSTGCVYALESAASGGSVETDPPSPIGEYAYSCLGRERIFEHYSRLHGTPALLFRLNYAIDLRYGVLLDIARDVCAGKPVDVSVSVVNVIWQGDANSRALLCLEHTASPPTMLNVTGPEILSVPTLAQEFARLFGVGVQFCGVDTGKAYLSSAARCVSLFGPPRVSVQQMIEWVAEWIRIGGRTLGKPTQFRVADGQFLSKDKPK